MLDKNDLQAIAELIRPMQEDISGIKKDLSGLDQRVSILQEDVAGLKEDIADLKEVTASHTERLTRIEVVQETVTDRTLQLLIEGQQGINEKFKKLDRMEMTLNEVKSDTEVIKDVVAEHSKSIRALKAVK